MSSPQGSYGGNRTCPSAPIGNKNLINYMSRLEEILSQLIVNQDKETALNRIAVLRKEISLTKQKSC